MNSNETEIILIGGSAGCISIISQILAHLPASFPIPIVIVMHRMKNVASEMTKIFSTNAQNKKIIEPDDKSPVLNNHIYLAPQNYHLLFEDKYSFSLDYSETVNYSRPSIDVSFESAAKIYASKATGILLSGSNRDGANGIGCILHYDGTALVQSPETAEYSAMPEIAINENTKATIMSPEEIIAYLLQLHPLYQ